MGRHFISYSGVDAADFALRLVAELAAGRPAWDLWLDKRELKPGLDWDEQIGAAIKACDSLLFVMSRDSVVPSSVCKREWTLALKYHKPVIPLRLHLDAELPFRLEPRQYIDFAADPGDGLARLRSHLAWLGEPAGVLQTLRDRLEDALRGLSRTPEPDRPRRSSTTRMRRRRCVGAAPSRKRALPALRQGTSTKPGGPVTRSASRSRWPRPPRRRAGTPPSSRRCGRISRTTSARWPGSSWAARPSVPRPSMSSTRSSPPRSAHRATGSGSSPRGLIRAKSLPGTAG